MGRLQGLHQTRGFALCLSLNPPRVWNWSPLSTKNKPRGWNLTPLEGIGPMKQHINITKTCQWTNLHFLIHRGVNALKNHPQSDTHRLSKTKKSLYEPCMVYYIKLHPWKLTSHNGKSPVLIGYTSSFILDFPLSCWFLGGSQNHFWMAKKMYLWCFVVEARISPMTQILCLQGLTLTFIFYLVSQEEAS